MHFSTQRHGYGVIVKNRCKILTRQQFQYKTANCDVNITFSTVKYRDFLRANSIDNNSVYVLFCVLSNRYGVTGQNQSETLPR